MSFRDSTLYSYSTAIAAIVKSAAGELVALITCRSYSITTSSKHMPEARRAVSHMPQFYVPHLDVEYPGVHAENLNYLVAQYRELCGKLRRMLSNPYNVSATLQEVADTAREYAAAFGLTVELDNVGDAVEVEAYRAAREIRRNTPAAIRKREKGAEYRAAAEERKRERRAEENRIALLASAERIALWRSGDARVALRYHENKDENGSAFVRARGENVETSLGAVVPLEHARKLFAIVARCRAEAREFVPNGHTIHVGSFTVSRISATGDLTAGCHYFTWGEIERFAVATWGSEDIERGVAQ